MPINTKQELRAKKEREVVRVCKERMEEKVAIMTERKAEKKQQIEDMELEILRRSDAGEEDVVIQRLVDQLSYVERQAEFDDGIISVFSAVRNVLLDLQVYVDALVQFEWYGYIIRTIPERKLPKMIRSENQKDLLKVMALTQTILEKIEDKIAATVIDKAQFDETMRKIKATAAELKSRYVKENAAGMSKTVEEIRRKRGLAQPLAVPVTDEADARAEAHAINISNV